MEEQIPVIGILISILGIISAISYKFYRDSKKDHTISGFNKGKFETTIEFLKEEIKHVNKLIYDIENDIEKGQLDYDSIQKQIADIRERIARMEGPQ